VVEGNEQAAESRPGESGGFASSARRLDGFGVKHRVDATGIHAASPRELVASISRSAAVTSPPVAPIRAGQYEGRIDRLPAIQCLTADGSTLQAWAMRRIASPRLPIGWLETHSRMFMDPDDT